MYHRVGLLLLAVALFVRGSVGVQTFQKLVSYDTSNLLDNVADASLEDSVGPDSFFPDIEGPHRLVLIGETIGADPNDSSVIPIEDGGIPGTIPQRPVAIPKQVVGQKGWHHRNSTRNTPWMAGRGHKNEPWVERVFEKHAHPALWIVFFVWMLIFIRVHTYIINSYLTTYEDDSDISCSDDSEELDIDRSMSSKTFFSKSRRRVQSLWTHKSSDEDGWPTDDMDPYKELKMLLFVFLTFVVGALIFNVLIFVTWSKDAGITWFVGYLQEIIFAMENMFAFLPIITSFSTPSRLTTKALFYVVVAQITFQFLLYIDLAQRLESLKKLPYILGVWLIYLGCNFLMEDHARGEPSKEVIKENPVAKLFSSVFGDRFVYRYNERTVYEWIHGKLHITLLAPVIVALLVTDLLLEVDVTLTKIETINNMYLAWTSSAFAAFTLPEFFFLAQMLFERYESLKYGICVILVFFGIQLLLEDVFEIPSLIGVGIIFVVIVGCILFDVATEMKAARRMRELKLNDSAMLKRRSSGAFSMGKRSSSGGRRNSIPGKSPKSVGRESILGSSFYGLQAPEYTVMEHSTGGNSDSSDFEVISQGTPQARHRQISPSSSARVSARSETSTHSESASSEDSNDDASQPTQPRTWRSTSRVSFSFTPEQVIFSSEDKGSQDSGGVQLNSSDDELSHPNSKPTS